MDTTQWVKPFMIHPRTGALLRPIATLPSGRVVWPIMGAADDDDASGGSSGGSGDGNTGGSAGTGASDDDGKKKQDPSQQEQEPTVSKSEYDKLMERMQAADRAKAEVEKRLKEIDDRDKTDLQKAQDRVGELENELSKVKEQSRENAVRLAFMMTASNIQWHDPEDALAFAMRELGDVEVRDDGSVDKSRVQTVVQKLVKDKAYLVKQQTSGDDDANDASGDPMHGNSKDKSKLSRDKMAEKYPALRR